MSDIDKERARKFQEMNKRILKSPLYKRKLSDYALNGIGLSHIQTLPLTTKEDLRKAGIFGHLAVDMKLNTTNRPERPGSLPLPGLRKKI
jgi:phenylacetate-CoA ligase